MVVNFVCQAKAGKLREVSHARCSALGPPSQGKATETTKDQSAKDRSAQGFTEGSQKIQPKTQLQKGQPPGLKSGRFKIPVVIRAQRFSHQVGKAIDIGLGRRRPRSDLKAWPHCCNTLALQPHLANAKLYFRGARDQRPHAKNFFVTALPHNA